MYGYYDQLLAIKKIIMIKKILFFIFLFSFLSCSSYKTAWRAPAAITDEISYYLSIDRFKYYLNEYSLSFDGKVPPEIITSLRSIAVKDLIDMQIDADLLSDANNYDEIIFRYLKSKGLTANIEKEDLKWNYNFFKTKLNEAFVLSPSKLNSDIPATFSSKVSENEAFVRAEILNPEEVTLDSGHYISSRTTRAMFWDAIENKRTIEFYMGDSREFLKQLREEKGEILYEIKPLAKNYNKIFIVKYPGEKDYRYALTNIGGSDRLNHLVSQLSLSNLKSRAIKNKIILKGNLQKFQEAKVAEHTLQLRLLPPADRVIIGQKESIDGKFYIFWKIKALKNLYDKEPRSFVKKLGTDVEKKLQSLYVAPFEIIFKEKKTIEDAFLLLQPEFEKNPKVLPPKFKIYTYDNFTVGMSDYVFRDIDKNEIRWRVISNAWGDEIVPIAEALKKTGHKKIIYIGTAGAFAGTGHKVGDLVIPSSIQDGIKKTPIQINSMMIEGGKYGGNVEHVGSPFEETQEWLELARKRSHLVEVETAYLGKIFKDPGDKLEIYLLVSDILGSENETLAHSTSSKRKNMQNKLLAKLFTRDSRSLPEPVVATARNFAEKKRDKIFKMLEKKSASYRYFAYSHLKETLSLNEGEIVKFAEENSSFSDAFTLDRLTRLGVFLHDLNKRLEGKIELEIGFSKSLVTGTWNPKNEKIDLFFKAKNFAGDKKIKEFLSGLDDSVGELSSIANVSVSLKEEGEELVWMKVPEKIDLDFFVKIYSLSGFKNAGLYQKVTYNGNLALEFLPTSKTEESLDAFYKKSSTKTKSRNVDSCIDAMRLFTSGQKG